jgi:tetratricopeptide (TPR) repeat protein
MSNILPWKKRRCELPVYLDGLTQLTPDEMISWGDSLSGAGNLEEAFTILKKAEAQDPRSLRLCLVMAKLLGLKSDLEGALAYEERALALDATNTVAWSGKGYALMKLGRLPAAVETLETAVRLDPDLSNAWIAASGMTSLPGPRALIPLVACRSSTDSGRRY